MVSILKRSALLVTIALAGAGCTALQDFLAPLSPAQTEAPAPATPPVAEQPQVEPLAANEFWLDSADQTVIGQPQYVLTDEANTFSLLAREYGLGYDELVAANPDVDPWLPGQDTVVLLPTQYVLPNVPREGIVLNIASKRLFYFPEAAEGERRRVLTYPIGIGRVGWETPLGHSAVISKATDPHWWVPASVRKEHEEMGDPLPAVVPPGPDNPLGRHVLKLDLPGYLIHGTNRPYGVGMRVSHGCVRLYPENIEDLYSMVGIGVAVTIVNEPFLAGQHDGEVLFEAHAPLEDDLVPAEQHLADIVAFVETAKGAVIDDDELQRIREAADDGLGIPVAISGTANSSLMARALVVRNTVEPDPSMPTLEEVRALLDAPPEAASDTVEVAADVEVAVDVTADGQVAPGEDGESDE